MSDSQVQSLQPLTPQPIEKVVKLLPRELERLDDIPLELIMELTRAKITVRELLELAPGATLALPEVGSGVVRVLLGSQCIAEGEIASADQRYGVRLHAFAEADAEHPGGQS